MANEAWRRWKESPMDCYQNQVNLAVWCSSAGCGVSYQDHLQSGDKLVQSVYRYHVNFQTRRILEEIKVALPDDESFCGTPMHTTSELTSDSAPSSASLHARICGSALTTDARGLVANRHSGSPPCRRGTPTPPNIYILSSQGRHKAQR